MGHFGYYLIDDFHYDKILGTSCIYLDLFDQANCFKCILIYGLGRIERKEVEISELDVDIQCKALWGLQKKDIAFFIYSIIICYD